MQPGPTQPTGPTSPVGIPSALDAAGNDSIRADAAIVGQPSQTHFPPARKMVSVVVVDGSPLSLLAVAGVLDSQGYGCMCCRDGDSAIKAMSMGPQDLIVWDVGDDAMAVLETLQKIRSEPKDQTIPAVLLADVKWAGLEKKIESLPTTRCLFKPIDPMSLVAVTEQVLWMPSLVDSHRRRGSRPSRPGWVTL